MPNAKVLSEKQAIVAELTEKIQKATAGVIVDYKGITVEEDTALRKECREGGVDYAVVKNTLLRFAFNNTGLNDLDDLLNGTTSLALADDPVAPARVMADYAKKLDGKFEIKGGFMDGKPVDLATIQSLASIPALPVLQAQVLGTMLAPITGLAVVLKQIAEKNGAPAEGRHRVGKPDDLHRQGGSHLCQARLRSGTLSGGRAVGPQCRLGHVPPSLIFSAKVSFFPRKTRFKLQKSSVSMDTELFMLQKVLLTSARPCRRPLRSASSEPRPRPC